MPKLFHYQLGSYFLTTAHLYPVCTTHLIESLRFVDCSLLNEIRMQQARSGFVFQSLQSAVCCSDLPYDVHFSSYIEEMRSCKITEVEVWNSC